MQEKMVRNMAINQPKAIAFIIKAILALSCTSLLLIKSVPSLDMNNEKRRNIPFEILMGACFLTLIVMIALCDVALAILVCVFLTCYIYASSTKHNASSFTPDMSFTPSQVHTYRVIKPSYNQHMDSIPRAFTLGTQSLSTSVA